MLKYIYDKEFDKTSTQVHIQVHDVMYSSTGSSHLSTLEIMKCILEYIFEHIIVKHVLEYIFEHIIVKHVLEYIFEYKITISKLVFKYETSLFYIYS